jgi:anaerobic ribonucleoside-triphosphate reductase
MNAATTARWPCPCCGYQVFTGPPGSYEICPVCGWEDDLS